MQVASDIRPKYEIGGDFFLLIDKDGEAPYAYFRDIKQIEQHYKYLGHCKGLEI